MIPQEKRSGLIAVLRHNPNYRYTWIGQVVSEVGDNFNNIAVFGLALANTKSGLIVAGILVARGVSVMLAGPIAGVLLDRMDRRRIMILSDLIRAVVALGFILAIPVGRTWLLYALSGLLMFASPFFTSGRAAILPSIASKEELHSANALTQLTQWSSLTIGSFLGGAAVSGFGYKGAFLFNAASFIVSAFCISRLRVPEGFRPKRKDLGEDQVIRPWREYTQGLKYMRSSALIFGIGLVNIGWATGGGAAQVLFGLFGEVVFQRGARGIGIIWGWAGVGLIIGAMVAHWLSKRLSFAGYKRTVSICYILHGGSYVLFSLAPTFGWACFFIGMSRAAVAVSSTMNMGNLLRHVSHEYRGRVFSTIETWTWMTMMVSMAGAGVASDHISPRTIGVVSGVLSSLTAVFWGWANYTGKLPEPARAGIAAGETPAEEVEVHGDPTV